MSYRIILPDNRGYIDSEHCQGFFTVAVLENVKKPVEKLTASAFLLYADGEFVDTFHVTERITGIYDLRFALQAERVLGLTKNDSGVKPLEVMLLVKFAGRYSNALLVPFLES